MLFKITWELWTMHGEFYILSEIRGLIELK
jgi:hypothetical protein